MDSIELYSRKFHNYLSHQAEFETRSAVLLIRAAELIKRLDRIEKGLALVARNRVGVHSADG
jgi:hypothetical protein